MGLLDEAQALSKRSGPQTSKILRLIESLSGKERDEVVELIWDHAQDLSAVAVATVLDRHYGDRVGEITQQQVQAHRKKQRP